MNSLVVDVVNLSLKDRIAKLKGLSINESMELQANLIDDLVQTYYESLKRKYPDATFEELMLLGHKETYHLKRRSENSDRF